MSNEKVLAKNMAINVDAVQASQITAAGYVFDLGASYGRDQRWSVYGQLTMTF